MHLTAKVNVSANKGFIHSVTLRFSKTDSQALLHIWYTPDYWVLNNLIAKEVSSAYSGREGTFKTVAVDYPTVCSMEIWFYWAFLDDNKLDHVETITTEITYFNGATFQMATMPMQLRIFAEITETTTAETVQFSTMRLRTTHN